MIGPRYGSLLRPYAVAVGATLLAQLLNVAINVRIEHQNPFVLFFAAVLVSAWYGGLGPAVVAIVASTLLSDFYFLPPYHSLWGPNVYENLRLVVFVFESAIVTLLAVSRREAETELEASRERFRLLVEGAHDHALLMLDPHGYVAGWNAGAMRLQGYRNDEIVGRHISQFYTPEDVAAGRPEEDLKIAASEGRCETEGWRVRKDGSRFWSSVVLTALWDADGHLRGFSQVMRDVDERRRLEEEKARAQAIQQSLRMALQHERDIVQTLAEGYLHKAPEIPGFDVAYYYQPASEKDHVGGDYFDFFPLDAGRYGVVIGDVCGKGLSAAVHTATARHMLRAYALEDPTPDRVMTRLNRALLYEMDGEGKFVTLIYGVLDTEAATFTYVNAGHPPPILYDAATARCERLLVTGGVIGILADMAYEHQCLHLAPGTAIVFFTDGVLEAAGCFDPYGEGGIASLLAQHAAEDADAIALQIFERSRKLAGAHRRDDMAVIAIRRNDPLPMPGDPSSTERGVIEEAAVLVTS